ncbi:MAG: retropepsin-like aspartic protease family protein [Candidatus Nucleicultricaceae bacterium]
MAFSFDRDDLIQIISLSALALYFIIVLLRQLGIRKFLSMFGIYGAFIVVGVGVYTYVKNPEGASFKNVYQELNPSAGVMLKEKVPAPSPSKDASATTEKENVRVLRGNESLSFRKSLDGHFYLTIEVQGKPIRFLLDTGATRVVLSQSDAKKLGIHPSERDYKYPAHTANGITYNAFVTIPTMKLGPLTLHEVPAAVSKMDDMTSILGMSFLDKIPSWTMKGDYLMIKVYSSF